MRKMIIFLVSLFITLSIVNYSLLLAWDNESTHRTLTATAFDYANSLSAAPYGDNATRNILSNAARNEDDPISRAWFHFYPAINSIIATATCSSYDWAFGNEECTGTSGISWKLTNSFKWSDAVDNDATDTGWTALGHVLHLLEDLAVPAHVRNDPHGPADGDPLEGYARGRALPPVSEEPLLDLSARALFNSLQQYTQENFFSNDTCFHPDFPGPTAVREDADYFYDSDDRRIAYKGIPYYLSKKNREYCSINDTIVQEQFNVLSPKAVIYAASLVINYAEETSPSHACYPNLPSPQLVFTGTEDYVDFYGNDYTSYKLTITNSLSFPDNLFVQAPELPPCGLNTNSSRTWVLIYNNNGQHLYGFCGLATHDSLTQLWFGLPKGTTPPPSVYIQVWDRKCDITYTSIPLIIQ